MSGIFAGRPMASSKKGMKKEPTRHVRVKPDIAEAVAWICLAEDIKSKDLLDPILRGPIEAREKKNEKAIAVLKKARADAKKAEAEARTPRPSPE